MSWWGVALELRGHAFFVGGGVLECDIFVFSVDLICGRLVVAVCVGVMWRWVVRYGCGVCFFIAAFYVGLLVRFSMVGEVRYGVVEGFALL